MDAHIRAGLGAVHLITPIHSHHRISIRRGTARTAAAPFPSIPPRPRIEYRERSAPPAAPHCPCIYIIMYKNTHARADAGYSPMRGFIIIRMNENASFAPSINTVQYLVSILYSIWYQYCTVSGINTVQYLMSILCSTYFAALSAFSSRKRKDGRKGRKRPLNPACTRHNVWHAHAIMSGMHMPWYLACTCHGIRHAHAMVSGMHMPRYGTCTCYGIKHAHAMVSSMHMLWYQACTCYGIIHAHVLI
jgi:hypothetical protein